MDQSQSRAAIRIMQLQYSYTLLKFLDLLDTVFFVLRKKDNQVTFLHVYHHLLMAGFGWVVCKFFVGGQIYYVGIANLPVHSVMYFYYFLTAWDSSYKRSIWWKKHLTQFQIVSIWGFFFFESVYVVVGSALLYFYGIYNTVFESQLFVSKVVAGGLFD